LVDPILAREGCEWMKHTLYIIPTVPLWKLGKECGNRSTADVVTMIMQVIFLEIFIEVDVFTGIVAWLIA
jgi:hypothetical protein